MGRSFKYNPQELSDKIVLKRRTLHCFTAYGAQAWLPFAKSKQTEQIKLVECALPYLGQKTTGGSSLGSLGVHARCQICLLSVPRLGRLLLRCGKTR